MMTAARAPQPPIQPRSEARRPWRRSRLPLSALALAAALAGGCGHGHGANKTSKPAEVIVTQPVTAELVDYQDFTGRLSAVKSVDMTARVSGYLEWIHFNEGDVVQKGAKLFSIDPRTYQAKYDKAVADLAHSRATKKAADYEAVRQRDLMNKRAGAKTDLDLAVGKAEEAAAFVKYCESAVADVKIDLDYTLVTAPITGRISKYYITEGNLVMADKTLLTTIVSEDPIYVNFDVDERTLLNLLGPTYRKVGRLPDVRFPVLIRLANEDEFRFDPKHAGVVNFIDNQVTATSGTIRMRGVFHNPDGQLKAGLFARPPADWRREEGHPDPRRGADERPGSQIRFRGQQQERGHLSQGAARPAGRPAAGDSAAGPETGGQGRHQGGRAHHCAGSAAGAAGRGGHRQDAAAAAGAAVAAGAVADDHPASGREAEAD